MKHFLFTLFILSAAWVSAQESDSLQLTTDDLHLKEVNVSARRASSVKSRTSAFDTQKLNSAELCKAACCNLSESFETNASVDVAYADAATGAKQIRLLGLQGTYVQLLTENTPGIRGLAQSFGMEYIPGPWMESIQISKGTASVINGYEATAGQINIEYLKPSTSDPIAINLMMNTELRSEVNLTGGWEVVCPDKPGNENNPSVSTGLLAHAQYSPMGMDGNNDRFLDMPTGQQVNLLNRWDIKKGNYTGRILVRGIYDQRYGGQRDILFKKDVLLENPYLIDLRTYRIDGFMKNGVVIDPDREMSVGIITALSYHNQTNKYGYRRWDAAQTNAYLNAMFSMEPAEGHKITTGISTNFDRYTEWLDITPLLEIISDLHRWVMYPGSLNRWEVTPGVFAEYSFHAMENLSLLAGVRLDWSSKYGVFCTPRMNMRYSPWEWWNIRVSAGMGYRSPNLIADNAAFLPSARKIYWRDADGIVSKLADNENLQQERAVNAGLSTTFYIPMGKRELQLSAEYYYTHFLQCLIADLDTDPHGVIFSNLNGGRSFSHSWQVEASMEILRGWTMTAAFRQNIVRQTINGNLREKPLAPRFKGIISTSYQTPLKHWQFDVTAQFNGGGRMPDPDSATPLWQSEYKWYPQLMAQITKYWRTCSLYVGAENMTNYMQENPIIAADQPYSNDFDASMVYAPISGWKIYVGFRWNLQRKEE